MLNQATTKGLLYDIMAMGKYSKQLLNKGKEYNDLLSYIIDNSYYWDDNKERPTIKEVLDQTGLSYSKLKRLVKKLHDDLLYNEENELYYNFNEVEYFFSLSYFDNHAYFSVKQLPFVPRVGEHVDIPYFGNYVGTTFFHVASINHEFNDGKQIVYIELKSGAYNKYWHIRRDEAEMKNEIHWEDFYRLKEYQLKEKLGLSKF